MKIIVRHQRSSVKSTDSGHDGQFSLFLTLCSPSLRRRSLSNMTLDLSVAGAKLKDQQQHEQKSSGDSKWLQHVDDTPKP